MKYLQYIIYGIIVGNWLLGVRGRLSTCKVQGRYAVVAMHVHKEEFVLVGRTNDMLKAEAATDVIEANAMCYIGLCYDLMDPADRADFDSKFFCPYIEDEDRTAIENARGML